MASPTAIEHAVAGTEREVAEHRFGLVREQELQRVVRARARARAAHHHGDDRVGEGGLGAPGVDHAVVMRSCSAATAARTISGLPSKYR